MKKQSNAVQEALEVGWRIKALRKVFDLTQAELAEVIGVERATLAQWERGANMARISAMIRLTRRFPVSLDFIYKGDVSSLPYHIGQEFLVQTSSYLKGAIKIP